MGSFIEVQNVDMVFNTAKGSFHALHQINLSVAKGEFVTLIGHSGCGKSTLLNLIAGLNMPSQGVLLCNQREIAAPGPERGVVFQNHSLLPWLTCFDNVHLAVEQVFGKTEPKPALKARTLAALALVNMGHAADKRPHEISGGMKQRIGIARALAMEPKVLLMETKCTVVMVTHDVDEAVLLSDRIVMMTNGPAATVGEIVPVPIERPRNRVALAEDPRYMACRKAMLDFLYTRHHRVEA
jgi:nitrate/nitrite transport system ATP-binding protein